MNCRWSNFKIESWLTTLDFTQIAMCIKVWKLRNGSAWLGTYISWILFLSVSDWVGHKADSCDGFGGVEVKLQSFCSPNTSLSISSLTSVVWGVAGSAMAPRVLRLRASFQLLWFLGQVWVFSAVTGLAPLQDIHSTKVSGNKNWHRFQALPNLPPISPSWLACPVDFKIHYCPGRQQP